MLIIYMDIHSGSVMRNVSVDVTSNNYPNPHMSSCMRSQNGAGVSCVGAATNKRQAQATERDGGGGKK